MLTLTIVSTLSSVLGYYLGRLHARRQFARDRLQLVASKGWASPERYR